MKAATILSLAAAAVAAPTISQPRAESTAPKTFGGISARSGSNIHLLPVSANGQQFWLNKPTTTYCPEGVVDCPENETPSTVFAGGDNTLSLSVTVPGGQQVYVNSKGLLKFTQAHSASMDPDSTATGFSIDEDGHLLFDGQSWYACDLGEAYNNTQSIYSAAKVAGQGFDNACQGFSWITTNPGDAPQTWQYV